MERIHHLEEYKDVRAGDYLISDESDNFYNKEYWDGDGLGSSVEIFEDYIIAGVPNYESDERGRRDDSGIVNTYGDIGAVVFYKLNDSNEYQVPVKLIEGRSNNDWANFGRTMTRHGDNLAISSPYSDFQTFQSNVGTVDMYKFSSDGSSIDEIDSGMGLTTKELFKGGQYLGYYMDFSDNHVICGVPDFSLTIDYNNPYVQWYSMSTCGALYFFKWQ